jgi:hypothetical protein
VENPYAGQGPVLLDIGGAVGALVVTMPAELAGAEIEIGRLGHGRDASHGHHHRPHVAVVARPVLDGLIHSLVFPELLEGDYELNRRPDGPAELAISIVGGTVTEATWPDSGVGSLPR